MRAPSHVTWQVVPEPNVIVSVGMDRRVHVWAINTGGNPIGTKLGTLLQGVGVNASWKFGYEYERVARERESLEALHVKGLIDEVRELVVPVDISVSTVAVSLCHCITVSPTNCVTVSPVTLFYCTIVEPSSCGVS